MTADVWYVRGEAGAVHRMTLPFGEGIAGRLASGALVRVNPDGTAYTAEEPAAPATEEAATLAEQRAALEREEAARQQAPVERPEKSSPKPAWIDYAVHKGMTRTAAEDLTKAELVSRYGG